MADEDIELEFDVYMNGSLNEQLHLLQYPLRPHYRHYGDQGNLESVEMGIQTTPVAGGKL